MTWISGRVISSSLQTLVASRHLVLNAGIMRYRSSLWPGIEILVEESPTKFDSALHSQRGIFFLLGKIS